MTTCLCQVHCGTLTVSVYPIDCRSDVGRRNGVTINCPRRKCWTKNEPWTIINDYATIPIAFIPVFKSDDNYARMLIKLIDVSDNKQMQCWQYWLLTKKNLKLFIPGKQNHWAKIKGGFEIKGGFKRSKNIILQRCFTKMLSMICWKLKNVFTRNKILKKRLFWWWTLFDFENENIDN